MKFIIPLAISIVFIIYGIVSVVSPSTIKNSFNRSHKSGLKDSGVSDEAAEAYVKKAVVQSNWFYRMMGIISVLAGSLLFYAVLETLLSS